MGSCPSTNIIRKSLFDGRFYPHGQKVLKRELEFLFRSAAAPVEKEILPQAIISPHAGYVFSGEVAASAFNQIPAGASYKRVFVLASSHHLFFKGASVYCDGDYQTPLGNIKVDRELAGELVENHDIFNNNREAHNLEHSLEVQLPFLQYRLADDFLLVPVILGTQSDKDCESVARVLSPYFNKENLFVISTDFSHYPEYRDATKVDKLTSDAIITNNPDVLLRTIQQNKKKNYNNLATSLCGWTSVLTLMYITQNKNVEYKKIIYKNSGDIALYGDKSRVVGYQAIAVFNKEELPFSLSGKEKHYLLEIARNSLERYFRIKNRAGVIQNVESGKLSIQTGAFVSLYNKGKLRGCIGSFFDSTPLPALIERLAVSAAKDHRFDSVTYDEVSDLVIEISVLTPLKRINSINEIELGKHGIYIQKGGSSGTFLPQVAEKTGWSLEEFLGHCSKDKAGLGWDGWKTADIYTYEAIVFREGEELG